MNTTRFLLAARGVVVIALALAFVTPSTTAQLQTPFDLGVAHQMVFRDGSGSDTVTVVPAGTTISVPGPQLAYTVPGFNNEVRVSGDVHTVSRSPGQAIDVLTITFTAQQGDIIPTGLALGNRLISEYVYFFGTNSAGPGFPINPATNPSQDAEMIYTFANGNRLFYANDGVIEDRRRPAIDSAGVFDGTLTGYVASTTAGIFEIDVYAKIEYRFLFQYDFASGCIGDYNVDGEVDFFDMLTFQSLAQENHTEADIDGDGEIDGEDANDLLSGIGNGGCS